MIFILFFLALFVLHHRYVIDETILSTAYIIGEVLFGEVLIVSNPE